MSWSVAATGTIEGVKKSLEKQFETCAKNYEGKPEGDDVAAVKARVFALIDALDLTSDGYTVWNGAIVSASGSHSSGAKGVNNASASFNVQRTAIAL